MLKCYQLTSVANLYPTVNDFYFEKCFKICIAKERLANGFNIVNLCLAVLYFLGSCI